MSQRKDGGRNGRKHNGFRKLWRPPSFRGRSLAEAVMAGASMAGTSGASAWPSGFATPPPLLVYSWQPLRMIAGGSDGARHAGMSQRLAQIIRSACRIGLEPTFISGQPMHHSKREESSTKRGTVWVGQCRVNHYYGTTANQYAQLSADGLKPRFAFIFYTAAWFAIEQRAIRNATGFGMQ